MDFPGKTLGVVGLIVAVFANLIGLIISIIALNQSRRAGRKNTPAVAGIIVGAILTLVGIVLAIFAVFLGIAAAAAHDETVTLPPAVSSTPNGDTGEDGTDTDVFTITVGDCFDDQAGNTVTEVPVVACTTPHDYEVYADFTIPAAAEYPGDDVIDQQADAGCEDAYQAFVGIAYDDSVYGYTYFTPTETSWTTNNDRLVSCLIGDPNGNKTTGTLKGAAK